MTAFSLTVEMTLLRPACREVCVAPRVVSKPMLWVEQSSYYARSNCGFRLLLDLGLRYLGTSYEMRNIGVGSGMFIHS